MKKTAIFEDVVLLWPMIYYYHDRKVTRFFEKTLQMIWHDAFSLSSYAYLQFGVIGHVSFRDTKVSQKGSFENKWAETYVEWN